jgi:hypothetical protein
MIVVAVIVGVYALLTFALLDRLFNRVVAWVPNSIPARSRTCPERALRRPGRRRGCSDAASPRLLTRRGR